MSTPGARTVVARTVVIVVYDGSLLLDAAGPIEVFSVAKRMGANYQTRLVSLTGGDVLTTSGTRLGVDTATAEITGRIDTLLIVGGPASREPVARELAAEVVRLAGRARRVTSVCTGTFVLGAAGLLTGRRVTTHWSHCALLAAWHPEASVEPDAIYVRDGDLTTSAGVTAGMDLALALVEEDHGAALARAVARQLVMFLQRPGGQSQFSTWTRLPPVRHEPLRAVLDAVAADPGGDHTVSAMAERAALSVRHFTRLFVGQVGVSPGQYVEQARVEAARTLLEAGDDGVELVARRCGFGSPETMRRAFVRILGVPPGAYRSHFRTTGILGATA